MTTPPTFEGLRLDMAEHTATLTLFNPPAHTWTLQSLDALRRLIDHLHTRRNIYALVVTGDGAKFFSAGADLKLFADGDKAVARAMATAFGEAFDALAAFRGVSIAAINGYAMGGGLECAMACDIRIAEEQVQMALPEATVGLLPCAGGTQRLARLVGEGWAKRMILCGERVDAAIAQRIGLVEEVVPTGQALARAQAVAALAQRQSPTSVAACKTLVAGARLQTAADTRDAERAAFVALFDTEDQREGVNAFLGKRTPQWRNA